MKDNRTRPQCKAKRRRYRIEEVLSVFASYAVINDERQPRYPHAIGRRRLPPDASSVGRSPERRPQPTTR